MQIYAVQQYQVGHPAGYLIAVYELVYRDPVRNRHVDRVCDRAARQVIAEAGVQLECNGNGVAKTHAGWTCGPLLIPPESVSRLEDCGIQTDRLGTCEIGLHNPGRIFAEFFLPFPEPEPRLNQSAEHRHAG